MLRKTIFNQSFETCAKCMESNNQTTIYRLAIYIWFIAMKKLSATERHDCMGPSVCALDTADNAWRDVIRAACMAHKQDIL